MIQMGIRRTCPSATMPVTDLVYTGLGLNPGLHSGRLVTKSLRHGAATEVKDSEMPRYYELCKSF